MKQREPVRNMYIGYVLAEDVWKEKRTKLLAKDEVLTEKYIDSLIRHGIKHMYIY